MQDLYLLIRLYRKGKMREETVMKRWIAMQLMLCAFSACAQAQSVPLTDYQPGQMIDAGFSQPGRFMAG